MVQLSKSNKKKLTSEILKNIENILQYFEIDYRKNDKCYMSHCPVHGGDNNSALNIYHSGDSENQGNWYCNTHSCHEVFGDDILGLIKGILSHNQKNWQTYGDNFISFTETIEWCSKFLNCELADSDIDKHLAIDHILTNALKLKRQKTQLKTLATIDRLRGSLEIPSNYFMGRGYKEETLKYFDVGDCTKSYKPMFERAVVPLHDSTGRKIIGCSGRSIWDQCRVCKSYHNPRQICKNQDSFWISSKWRHSKHFPSDVTLYNFHRALPVARKTGKIIITEGFPNVWRMFEAGF